jgi:hypothetical protein
VNRSYIAKRVDRLFRTDCRVPAERQGFGNNLLAVADVPRGASASPKTMGSIGEDAGVGAPSRGQLTAPRRADSIANVLATRRPTAIAACVMLRRN